MPKPIKRTPGLPTREQILDFISASPTPAGKREIARAFGLTAQDKILLKALLKDMADEGLIDSAPGRAFHKLGGLPKVTVLRIADVDDSGTAWAVPERWEAETPAPKLRVRERKQGALGVGDRILARTEEAGKGWIAHPMKTLPKGEELVLGVLRQEGATLWLQGVEKKERREFQVSDAGAAQVGDLVLAEKAGRPPRITVRVTQVLGDPFAPRSFSLIAIHKLGIPDVFSAETLEEAVRVAALPLGDKREDLRHLPIVAIDPADARDHDDAVWAAPDDDPSNDGGWKAIVAIADVSFYVRPGSSLDREARRRGNSVYFPDRVVPMLPESLSAEMCSLKEGVDRAALVCHLQVSKGGALKSWRFTRAVVRIAANLAYEDAQAMVDAAMLPSRSREGLGEGPATPTADAGLSPPPTPPASGRGELLHALLPLWGCWKALSKARAARAPLDLDLPERRVVLDEKGRILSVAPRERLDAHKLIEDYMIAANVAAAKALEAKKAPVMYRVHEQPSREKLVALKDYLKTYGIEFALGQVVRPKTFNQILDKVIDSDARPQIMEQVLRTQTQAYYASANMGHFGLALGSYGHFTSPIRRYADLIVHRSLVAAYELGPGGLTEGEAATMERIGESISMLERRAMEAERDTIDRYVAAFLSEKVGEVLETRITGVTNFGFFATVEGIGGDGLMPVRDLGGEYFRFDEASRTLVGEHSGTVFASGQKLPLRLAEANPVSGALRFEMVEGRGAAPERETRGKGPARVIKRRGRPANIRHQGKKR
ncbi:ribonuclease R [Sphingomonas sp. BE270]|jgi:ribonuclease R|uniref:ribonuclease R family protein n=1 Tax=unclassified Sphingomonas TaxID=196159 RepID=UPI001AE1E240|nr:MULTISPECIES: RNB domain-containing ribonuclease [unclassified Sphingomonas]MDR6849380.1 ribonuclease R [Sphingomonas sp. BE137]MDR7257482.1 ribonuclease R [Sphingomonas sp. BE270]